MTNIWSKLSFICGVMGIILLIPISYLTILVLTTPGREPSKFSDIASTTSILLSVLSIILGIIGVKKEKAKEAKRGIIMGVIIILYYVILFVASIFVQLPQ